MAQPKNLQQERFGKLVVQELSDKITNKGRLWQCVCDCGNIITTSCNSLMSGNTRSCGCLRKETAKRIDMTKQQFGRLTVLYPDPNRNHHWFCSCSCGVIKSIMGLSLRQGNTQSCGCIHKDKMKLNRLPESGAAKNKLYCDYKNKADKRGYLFDLEKHFFLEMTSQNCHYCGSSPNRQFRSKQSVYISNGIDRIDNNEGYLKHNVVPCCSRCNYAKRDMTHQEFLGWIEQVYNFQKRLL